MPKYGHVLVLYNCTQEQIEIVEVLLVNAFSAQMETVDNSIFFQMDNKKKISAMLDEVRDMGIDFSVFHNQVPTGSYFRSNGIAPDAHGRIEKIMRTG
jgi:hypothetical protein